MLGRAPRPPVLGRIPLRGSGSLDRESLDAMLALWSEIGQGVVLVTGEEGRSELAVGLAAAAAAAGRKGALIECEFAGPGMANALGLDPVPGFAEYLAHEAEAPEILQASILAGPGSTLAAAPLVCIVAGAATALGSALLRLRELRPRDRETSRRLRHRRPRRAGNRRRELPPGRGRPGGQGHLLLREVARSARPAGHRHRRRRAGSLEVVAREVGLEPFALLAARGVGRAVAVLPGGRDLPASARR